MEDSQNFNEDDGGDNDDDDDRDGGVTWMLWSW